MYQNNIIHPTAVIYDNVRMGYGNYIEAGAVIGCPGHLRDYHPHQMSGKVYIGNYNRIGANTTIHSGYDGITSIGNDNMIMSHVNIGHDVSIASETEICPHVTISGECKVMLGVKIKSGVVINTNKRIGSKSFIYSGSVITTDTEYGKSYKGIPAREVGSACD